MFFLDVVPTTESIVHQFNSKLFPRLTMACDDLKIAYDRVGQPTKSSNFHNVSKELAEIAKIIKEETNLSLVLGIYESPHNNAYVDIGPLGINHPFFKWAHDHLYVQQDDLDAEKSVTKLINTANDTIGWVDRVNGKVHGIFKEIDFDSKISYGLIRKGTGAGMAATILHELGHAWTLLEYLTGVVTRNYTLGSIAQIIMKQTDNETKVLIVDKLKLSITNKGNYPHLNNTEYQTATGRKFTTTDDLLETQVVLDSKSGDSLAVYLINAGVKPFYSDTGNYFYDTSGAEFLADQFATRFGAGLDLVMDLHEVYDMHPERSLFTRCIATALELFVIAVPWVAIIVILATALSPYPIKQYDDPKDRIIRIRNELTDALKNGDLSNDRKRGYINDIEKCNILLKEYHRYFSPIAFVTRILLPSKRKLYNDMRFQKKIEALANNNLFVTATKFELDQ